MNAIVDQRGHFSLNYLGFSEIVRRLYPTNSTHPVRLTNTLGAALIQNIERTVLPSLSTREISSLILSLLKEEFGADSGGVFLFNEEEKRLEIINHFSIPIKLLKKIREILKEDDNVIALAAKNRTVLDIDIPGKIDEPGRKMEFLKVHYEQVLMVPLANEHESYGILTLLFKKEKEIDEEHLLFVEGIGKAISSEIGKTTQYDKEIRIAATHRKTMATAIPKEKLNFELSASFSASTKRVITGYDFTDFIELDDEKFALVIGDISGRNIEASVLEGSIKTAMRNYIYDDPDPSQVLKKLNMFLFNQRQDQFATILYGLFGKDEVFVSRAGHPNPLMIQNTGIHGLGLDAGCPLGISDQSSFPSISIPTGELSMMIFYSDGLIEAQYGWKAFEDLVPEITANQFDRDPSRVAEKLKDEAIKFCCGFHDDITVIAANRK